MIDTSLLRRLKLPAFFALTVLIGLAAYYLFIATKRSTYLNSSNLRLLTTIGHHIDDWVRRQREIFRIVIEQEDAVAISQGLQYTKQWKVNPQRPAVGTENKIEPPTLVADPNGETWLELASKRSDEQKGDTRKVPFRVAILDSLPTDAFDVVLLATADGRILKRSGQVDLHVADLSSLPELKDFAAKASHTTDVKVKLTGTWYRVFMQPCCERLGIRLEDGGGSGATHAGLVVCGLIPSAAMTEKQFSISFSTMLIIAGILLMIVVSWPFMKLALIGNRQRVRLLDVLLLGISSLLILSIGTLYLLDFYAYTRLKTRIDEGLKSFSEAIQSNMKKEIAAAYSQLRALQSAALANPADSRFSSDVLQKHPHPDFSFYPFFDGFSLLDSEGFQRIKWSTRKRAQSPPPIPVKDRGYFRDVMENRTWSLPPECDRSLPDGRCEMLRPGIDRFALESIRSITRGNTQAVLAIPNCRVEETDCPWEKIPVATLAFPMISLINPVVPPGFGFAVIEDREDGRVMFHSEESRNLIEQFFLETDRNKRLQSVVAARRAEHMDFRYWGRDYRAYSAPLKDLPWSLVTFYEKDLVRSVNVDSIVTALLFLIPYMLGCVFVCFLILIWPQRRATWLWPHPRGLPAYLQLIAFYIVILLLFGAAVSVAGPQVGWMSDSFLLLFAFAFPALAWLGTYLRLWEVRRALPIAGDEITDPTKYAQEKTEASKLLSRSYMFAAALLLIITAPMPTAAFFKLAHSIQVVPYTKYNQVKLAAGLAERRQRAEKEASFLSEKSKAINLASPGQAPATISSRRIAIGHTQLQFDDGRGNKYPIPPVDLYHQPFETEIRQTSSVSPALASVKKPLPSPPADSLPAFLEPYLPYYSQFSVESRELLHDEAADRSRSWKRAPDNRIVLTSASYADGALEISSVVPTFGTLASLFKGRVLGVLVFFGAVLWMALAIMVFMARRVFLLDVPFWSSGWGGFAAPGQSLFVVCRRPDLRTAYLARPEFEIVDLAKLALPDAKPEDWNSELSRLDRTLSGEPLLLDHFEKGANDSRLTAKKLWLVEQLVARRRSLVILSSVGPFPLQHGGLPAEPDSKAEEGSGVEQKWKDLLTSSFAVIDLGPRFETEAEAPEKPGRMTDLGRSLGTDRWASWRTLFKNFLAADWKALMANLSGRAKVRQYQEVRNVLERECAGNPYLKSIHDDLDRLIRRRGGEEGLDKEEVLAEIEERASDYYEGLWACCSRVEKLALEHLAEHGFANYRDGKLVRRLIARGLVRRDPYLRVMNETFRRFVVSTAHRKEIAELEQETQASAWDRFRRPFGVVMALVLVLFVTTQKERFDAMMALIVGVTGVLPSLLNLGGLIIGDRSPLPPKPG